jgi:hypothetical protein
LTGAADWVCSRSCITGDARRTDADGASSRAGSATRRYSIVELRLLSGVRRSWKMGVADGRTFE